KSALLLPSIITRLDLYLSALELKNSLSLPVKVDYLISALTTPSAEMVTNYERLETLGKVVLDLCVTTGLYVSSSERINELRGKRKMMTGNTILYESAENLSLDKYVNYRPLINETWRPESPLPNLEKN